MVHPHAAAVHRGSALQSLLQPQPARWLMNVNDPTGRPMRWNLRLTPIDFSIVHRPGRKHQVPDELSRLKRDTEPDFRTGDDEICTIEAATGLAVLTHNASEATHPTVA